MLAGDDFISSPPKKTVRFGGTLTDILLKYERGETTDFELLKHQLSDPDIKDAQIINWLHEFRSSVTYLTKDFEQLVSILLKLPWLRRSREVVEEYLGFLGNLVSAQTVHLRPCLNMIVSQFVPPRVTIREDDVDISDSDDDEESEYGRKYGLCMLLVCNHYLTYQEEDEERKENKVVSPSSERMAHPLAERLDILMTILFAYIKDVCHVDGKLDINKTKDLYRDLVSVFDKLILPTHASCHVQYFIFHICSLKLGLAEAFLDHLWKKLQDPNNPSVIRQTAGSYIGSFLARAKFIPVVTVKACLDLLVNWMHKYIDNQDTGANAYCDVALHGPFYSACQAAFYTLIFRHKQLLDGNLRKGLSYLQSLNFERIVMCQLNPLKICIPSVVNLFAAITRYLFCFLQFHLDTSLWMCMYNNSSYLELEICNTNPVSSTGSPSDCHAQYPH
uniref:RRN3 homolog, RNA polymerase I transcription factor n=1 Tax=Pavo cristatus TaxID=9049 RepID=A0A8C9L9H7_PAVCR